MEDDFDTILTQLGTGRWTILYVVAMSYWYSLLPYHTVAGAFMAPYVGHTCHPPPHALTPTLIIPTDAVRTLDNASYIPNPDQPPVDSSCSYLVEDAITGAHKEESCTEWHFDNSTFISTVTSEFQLVCGRKYLRATYQSMYMFGMLVGAGFNGFLADKYGRWTMIAISTVSYTVIALGSAWLPSITTLLLARFLLGTMHPTSLQTGYILVLEVTELRMRSRIGLSQFITWSLGTVLFSAWAYLVREWRWLQTFVSLPCLLFLPLLWVLGESPRWLAVVGQHDRALRELKRAAAWNKVTLPPDHHLLAIMQRVQQQAVTNREHQEANKSVVRSRFSRILDRAFILFRTPKLRLITIIMIIDYFVVAMLFFGLTLGATALDIDHFVYVAIAGLVEIPSTTVMIPIVTYFGRKKMLIFNYGICAITLLSQPLVPQGLKWMSVLLVMLGKMASSTAFNIAFLFSLELFPTELRTQGMGAAMMSSRAGAIVAPFIMSALDANPWGISVVFGVAAAVAGLAVFPLWETQNTRLPDTVADLEGETITPGKEDNQSTQDQVCNGMTNSAEATTSC